MDAAGAPFGEYSGDMPVDIPFEPMDSDWEALLGADAAADEDPFEAMTTLGLADVHELDHVPAANSPSHKRPRANDAAGSGRDGQAGAAAQPPDLRERNRLAQAKYRNKKKQELEDMAACIRDMQTRLTAAHACEATLRTHKHSLLERCTTLTTALLAAQQEVRLKECSPTQVLQPQNLQRPNASGSSGSPASSSQPPGSVCLSSGGQRQRRVALGNSELVLRARRRTGLLAAADDGVEAPAGGLAAGAPVSVDLLSAHAAAASPLSPPSTDAVLHDIDSHMNTYRALHAARAVHPGAFCLYTLLPYYASPERQLSFGDVAASVSCFVSCALTCQLVVLESKLILEQLLLLDGENYSLCSHASCPDTLLPLPPDPYTHPEAPPPVPGDPEAGNDDLITWGVGEQVCAGGAIEFALSSLLQRYHETLSPARVRRACMALLYAFQDISSAAPTDSMGLSGAEQRVMWNMLKAAIVVTLRLAAGLQAVVSTLDAGDERRPARQPQREELQRRMRDILHADRLITFRVFTTAGKVPQMMCFATKTPMFHNMAKVETANARVFGALAPSDEQMEKMMRLWEDWVAKRRSLRHHVTSAIAALSKLPSPQAVPSTWLLRLSQLADSAPVMGSWLGRPGAPMAGAGRGQAPVWGSTDSWGPWGLAWCTSVLGASVESTHCAHAVVQGIKELQRQAMNMHAVMLVRTGLSVHGLSIEQHVAWLAGFHDKGLVDMFRVFELAAQMWRRSARSPLNALQGICREHLLAT